MIRRLFAELKRRNVIRGAVLYIGALWALAQGVSSIGPAFGMPAWGTRWFLIAGAIGFPFWIAFTWFYELTPDGLKLEREVAPNASITRQTGRRLDRWIIAVMAAAIVLLLTDRWVAHRIPGATAAVPDKSIAVLPFVNLSSDKEQEYFSDGISEDLLNLLTRVQALQVAARTSSFSFKGRDVPVAEIAATLHVANVLGGSVRKSGNAVRITAQLVRAADGYQIWSQTWDRTLDDIFKVQDEIAAAVVSELKVKLLGAAPTAKPVDPRVYPLILQAEALLNQFSVDGITKAISTYRQAADVAPAEDRVWAGLARAYFYLGGFGKDPVVNMKLSREAANQALKLDPDSVLAMTALARLATEYEPDLPAAAHYYERALQIEPGNLVVINSAATMLSYLGRFDDAIALFQFRVSHDPANAAYNNLANASYYARRWDAAIEPWRIALRLSP